MQDFKSAQYWVHQAMLLCLVVFFKDMNAHSELTFSTIKLLCKRPPRSLLAIQISCELPNPCIGNARVNSFQGA